MNFRFEFTFLRDTIPAGWGTTHPGTHVRVDPGTDNIFLEICGPSQEYEGIDVSWVYTINDASIIEFQQDASGDIDTDRYLDSIFIENAIPDVDSAIMEAGERNTLKIMSGDNKLRDLFRFLRDNLQLVVAGAGAAGTGNTLRL